MNLATGVITKDNYLQAVKTGDFKEMESFSDAFLARNRKNMEEYFQKWADDSLHLWSRQYEYLFFFEAVRDYVASHPDKKIRVLDAGSGLTFFPFYLQTKFSNVEVVCTDYDPIHNKSYASVNKTEGTNIKFVQSDLRDHVFEKESFDLIYCVSVLEHTDAYPKIVENFYDYLKIKGQIILSFDISLDGYRDISHAGSLQLIQKLDKHFKAKNQDAIPALNELKSGKFLNTLFFVDYNKSLLPWRAPYKNFLWCIKNMKVPKFYFDLACYCQVYSKE